MAENNKMKNKFNSRYIVLIFFAVLIIFLIMNRVHRDHALEKALKTYAIVVVEPFRGAKIPLSIKFRYKNQNGIDNIVARQVDQDCSSLEVGDTIYIRYSLIDNSVAEIIHCYWNDDLRKEMNSQKRKSQNEEVF